MSQHAIFEADYYTFEYKKGLKVCRLVFEVPYEHAKLVRDVLGDPPLPGEQVRVAIARLEAAAVPESDEAVDQSALPTAEEVRGIIPRTYTRSQKAALKCGSEDFQVWLAGAYPTIWDMHYIDGKMLSPEAATATLKKVLGIASRKELDTDAHKAAAWDALITSYELRDMVR